MSEELLKKFAQSLKERREEKRFTLQQVASKTKIDVKFLRAMEEGNFTIMPEVYIRAFIKDYAEVVELDVQDTLSKLDAAKAGKAEGDVEVNSEIPAEEDAKPKEEIKQFISPEVNENPIERSKTTISGKVIAILIAAILVLFLSVYFAFIKPSSEVIIKEKPFGQVLSENKRYESEEMVEPSNAKEKPDLINHNSASISLTLITSDTVWLRMRIDDEINKEITLKPGDEQIISANNRINLLVGNLGGIKFKLNDKEYDFGGQKGQVQNLEVNNNGIQKIKVAQVNVDE